MQNFISAVFVAVLFSSPRAQASFWGIPDSDTTIQLETLWENFKQTLQLGKILSETREVAQFAMDTSRAANSAVRVVNNAGHFINNPADFVQRRMRDFDDAFPEAGRTYQEIDNLRSSIANFNTGDGSYDPFAFQEALFYARKTGKNVYEIKSRLMDRDGVSSPHDAIVAELRDQKSQLDDLFNEVERAYWSNMLDPQMAAAYQARAAAQQARAAVISAAHQNEIARLNKIQFNNATEEKIDDEKAMRQEFKNMREMVPKDFSLNPWR